MAGDDTNDGRPGGSNGCCISSCRGGTGAKDGITGGGDIGHGSGGGGGSVATSKCESAGSSDGRAGDGEGGTHDSATGGCGGDAAGGEGPRQGFVDVSPLAGRAVVFFSGAVEHEVLPVTGSLPRAALTTWFH